jgi:hypothetical protein
LGSAKIEPGCVASAPKMPMTKAPLTLMVIVPQGNVSPSRRATAPETK